MFTLLERSQGVKVATCTNLFHGKRKSGDSTTPKFLPGITLSSWTYQQFLGQLQTQARTARQCFATTATTALPGTGTSFTPPSSLIHFCPGMFSEMIIPTASRWEKARWKSHQCIAMYHPTPVAQLTANFCSVTRMCLPTTATSAERSSGSTQKTFRTRRSIGTRPVSFATR